MIPASFWRSAASAARDRLPRLGRTANATEIHDLLDLSLCLAVGEHKITSGNDIAEIVSAVQARWAPFEHAVGEDGRKVADLLPMMLEGLAEAAMSGPTMALVAEVMKDGGS